MDEKPVVAICVATYKRPQFLQDLLESLVGAKYGGFQAHLLIADNDVSESARAIVSNSAVNEYLPVAYIVEPSRGIAIVRNLLVAEAEKINADYIAFVDDDQIVDPSWLLELVSLAIKSQCDVVLGRVNPLFDDDVERWAIESGLFGGRRYGPSGVRLRRFATGNVLLRADTLRQFPGPFDLRRNLNGGEDAQLSDQYRRRGFNIIWCNESVVQERIPKKRATISWIIRRQFNVGVATAVILRQNHSTRKTLLEYTAKGIGAIILGSGLLVPAMIGGRAKFVPKMAQIALGIGVLAGLLRGRDFANRYQNVEGR